MLPLRSSRVAASRYRTNVIGKNYLTTLAVETSCDDTSVAILSSERDELKVHFHEKITANNDAYNGIHPLVALHSHRANLAPLVKKALSQYEPLRRIDFITATRGPGMRSNLAVGLDTAKGLALGMNVPFLGVHHMQAHALTPRLVNAMKGGSSSQDLEPAFPFLTMLVSGGHTMLIDSTDLTEHFILAETGDITLGDCLDKAARAILPQELLKAPYGRALEDFAFPHGLTDYEYTAPARRQEELELRQTRWHWGLKPVFAESKGGIKTSRRMAYSFAGLLSAVERLLLRKTAPGGRLTDETRLPVVVTIEERRDLAREIQRVAFEHLASRALLHLASASCTSAHGDNAINTIVVSGGVASNQHLRHIMRSMLDARGFSHIKLEFPPIELCTDNALMIAWVGLEMWRAGYRSEMDIQPIKKWSMSPMSDDGGILGVGGWNNIYEGGWSAASKPAHGAQNIISD